jgi:antitoxin VapB
MNIATPRIEELAQRLAQATGEDVETAVARVLEEKLSRIARPPSAERQVATDRFLNAVARLQVRDDRTPDEIIGYGPDGLPS